MLLLLLLHSFVSLAASSDLSTDLAALLAFRSAVGGRAFLWNTTDSTPCNWAGVKCENQRVAVLRLPGSSLSGEIPANTLANLTRLRTLSLRLNSLSGSLPSDFSKCTELRNLYLQGNHFSGPVPAFLSGLHSLVRVNLASNNFSGEIPPGFNNLTRLRTLYLENNRLSGSIPELHLPNLDQFNVSFNSLNGTVPKTLETMPAEAFSGNSLCGRPLHLCPGRKVPAAIATGGIEIGKSNKKRRLSGGAIAGIIIGSILGFLLLLLAVFVLCRKRSGNKARAIDIPTYKLPQPDTDISGEKPMIQSENGDSGNGYSAAAAAGETVKEIEAREGGNVDKKLLFFGNNMKAFDLEDLLRASAEVLGKGTFGTTYKAVLEMGTAVAVKRLKDVTTSEKEFREKMESIGAMSHGNLVPLRAYYYSKEERLLVHDYLPMGSLSALLHGNKGASRTPLNWERRSGIALGAARGIEYLHSRGPNVSHGNIKSSNILLTKSYESQVSDFGLATIVGPSSSPTRVIGYRAPEVTEPRRVSQKADVYSFGVLLLELLTGKAPTHAILNEDGVDLPRWVQSVVREEWTSEVFDLELLRYQSVEEEMVQLLQLAIDCVAQYPDNRPSMSEVTRRIEELHDSHLGHHQEPSELVTAT
nr:probable inactive receptor kinase At1g48480 [Ipomoea batatas]